MRSALKSLAVAAVVAEVAAAPLEAVRRTAGHKPEPYLVSLGPRPYYLVHNMTDSPLKKELQACENKPVEITSWTIGHRGGGTLMIPEESVESTLAGARMGSGILECDVAFTSDRQLVCRHSLCDLHTTTDILLRPELAAKCTTPFTPANETADATALCCTSDITLDEYTSLCSKMDGFNTSATTPEDYQHGAPSWRTELYDTCAEVMTLNSFIDLVDSLPGYRNFTPELKTPPAEVPMPFNGYTQAMYAADMIEHFIAKGIAPSRVWPQSFTDADVYQWLNEYPEFGAQAVLLDESGDDPANWTTAVERLPGLKAAGVNIISPPMNYLITVGGPNNDTIVPSIYATTAMEAGLEIISWSFERSGPLTTVAARDEYYYGSVLDVVSTDGQMYEILDVLGRQIGITAMFSDWSSTTTYYANCLGFKGPGNN